MSVVWQPGEPLRTWGTDDWMTASKLNEEVHQAARLLYFPPVAGAWLSTNFTVASTDGWTFVPLDRTLFDTDGMFDESTGWFTIRTPGIYEVCAYVRVASTLTDEFLAAIRLTSAPDSTSHDNEAFYNVKNHSPSGTSVSGPYALTVMEFDLREGDSLGLITWSGSGDIDVLGYDAPNYYGNRTHMTVLWTGVNP